MKSATGSAAPSERAFVLAFLVSAGVGIGGIGCALRRPRARCRA